MTSKLFKKLEWLDALNMIVFSLALIWLLGWVIVTVCHVGYCTGLDAVAPALRVEASVEND